MCQSRCYIALDENSYNLYLLGSHFGVMHCTLYILCKWQDENTRIPPYYALLAGISEEQCASFVIAVSSACSVDVACFGFGDRCPHDINDEFVDASFESVEGYLLLMLNWGGYVKSITLDVFLRWLPVSSEARTPVLSISHAYVLSKRIDAI